MESTSKAFQVQKKAFLKYLVLMDLDMLDLILDERSTFYGASKETFLDKLSIVFKHLKILKVQPKLKVKKRKKGNDVYYLKVKYGSIKNKFTIEESPSGLLSLHGMNYKLNEDQLEAISEFDLFFGDDEKADFKPSNKYAINLQLCEQAFQQIQIGKEHILTSRDIEAWLLQYENLYREIKDETFFFKFNNFRLLYATLDDLAEEVSHFHEAKIALETFSDDSEEVLEQWLAEYHYLAFCVINSFDQQFYSVDLVKQTLQHSRMQNIYFKGEDFATLYRFYKLYMRHFTLFNTSKFSQ